MRKDGRMFMSCSSPFKVDESYKRNCDILVSYAYKSAYEYFIELAKQKENKPLFMVDSGAWTDTRGTTNMRKKGNIYLEVVNKDIEYIDYFAQLDILPKSRFTPSIDYDECKHTAEYNMENYLQVRKQTDHPEKILAVYHSGEPLEYLDWLIDFQPEIPLIGLALRSDDRDRIFAYLKTKVDLNKRKFHLLGVGNIKDLRRLNAWSSDSSTFIRHAAFNVLPCDLLNIVNIGNRENPAFNLDERQKENLFKYIKTFSDVPPELYMAYWGERMKVWLDFLCSKEFKDFVYVGDTLIKRKLF